MRSRGIGAAATAVVTALAGVLVAVVLPVAPASGWPAPPPDRTISPGDQVVTAGRSCSAGFVFRRGHRTYISYPASCALVPGSAPVASCHARALRPGTRVTFVDRGRTIGVGRLAWTSVRAMRRAGTSDHRTCAGIDFALVRVVGRSLSKVDPDLPFWGGPTRMGPLPRERALLFGFTRDTARQRPHPAGSLVLRQTSQRLVLSGLWPVPAVRGAGLVDGRGRAVAMVTGVGADGRAVAVGLAGAVGWVREHGAKGLRLVPGTEPFRAAVVF